MQLDGGGCTNKYAASHGIVANDCSRGRLVGHFIISEDLRGLVGGDLKLEDWKGGKQYMSDGFGGREEEEEIEQEREGGEPLGETLQRQHFHVSIFVKREGKVGLYKFSTYDWLLSEHLYLQGTPLPQKGLTT